MRAKRRLPPLNALRTFEVAARHLSFAQAAQELHVTPGAVSHQVTALENYLGIALFRRGTRAVALTAAAQACLPKLSEGFDCLSEAVERLGTGEQHGVLTVSVAPAFATRWLLPRLPSFTAAHPEVELRLSTGLGLIDALRPEASVSLGEKSDHRESADLAIRFGRGRYPGCRADKLFAPTVTPVCSPRLLAARQPLRSPGDLRHYSLLHDDTVYFDESRPDWAVWLEAANVEGVDAERGPRFSHTALALDAAVDGLGVALALSLLAEPDISAGRLVAPFQLSLASQFAYYLVYPDGTGDRPRLATFRHWLLGEAKKARADKRRMSASTAFDGLPPAASG